MRVGLSEIIFTLGFILVVSAWSASARAQRIDMFGERPETRSELEIRMQAEAHEAQCRAHRERKFQEQWPAFEQKITAEIYAHVGYVASPDPQTVKLISDQVEPDERVISFANSQTKETCRADYERPDLWVEDIPVRLVCAGRNGPERRLNFKLNVETGEIEHRKLHWFYRTPVWQN